MVPTVSISVCGVLINLSKCTQGNGRRRWQPAHPSTPISAAAKGTQSYSGSGAAWSRPRSSDSDGAQRGTAAGLLTPSCRVRSPYTQILAGSSSFSSGTMQTKMGKVVSRRDMAISSKGPQENEFRPQEHQSEHNIYSTPGRDHVGHSSVVRGAGHE